MSTKRYLNAGRAAVLAALTCCFAFAAQLKADPPKVNTMKTTEHKHTNRLIDATSPYLLQHAHNPVDWYPWGADALKKARDEDKPIFLSIGYAACHWCHVMEHESFEDEAVAAFLNEHFVCIKVDREQRPDLDDIYMQATVAMTGHGGWPMSVFMTPDLKPFFCGTYFRREQFLQLTAQIVQAWNTQREQLDTQAGKVAEYLEQWAAGPAAADDAAITQNDITQNVQTMAGLFDRDLGGIHGGGTNKFPPSMTMDLMLREYRRTGNMELLDLVELTLEKMAYGGVYDQLGGGIHRYSTDREWLVPHFEKMLYDQALVSDIYLDAYQLTKKPLYARIAREIFDWVLRDMTSGEGGFFSTLDADSEGLEGKYYIWTVQQVRDALDEKDAALFCAYYDVTDAGNWNEQLGHAPAGPKNILNVKRDLAVVAASQSLSVDDAKARLEKARETLLDIRAKRVSPGLDDKILASWNGLMIASLARGGRILNEPRYTQAAERAAEFVLDKMQHDGRLLRSYRNGRAELAGYLDDYADTIDGLLWLYETTFERKWLDAADTLAQTAIKHFHDDANGGFYFTADDHEALLVRSKDATDSATPSGNSVMAMNLLRLAVLLDSADYRAKADGTLKCFATRATQRPGSSERMLAAADVRLNPPKEIAIVGAANDERTQRLIAAVFETYTPNKVIALLSPGDIAAEKRIPLLAQKTMIDNMPSAYVCQNYTCQSPTTDVAQLVSRLE